MSIAQKAADLLIKNWRGVSPNDGRRMADDLKRAHLLAPDVPDVDYGLAIDGGGTSPGGISCALGLAGVALVASDQASDARVVLDARECRELGAWLLAAAVEIEAAR